MVRLKNGVSKSAILAAATAGMLLAGVGNASAAAVIEYSLNGGTFTSISTGSSTGPTFTINGLNAATTAANPASLMLSFTSLTFTAGGQSLVLQASDNGFTYDPAGANYLTSAGSISVNEPAGSLGHDSFSVQAGSDAGNTNYTYTSSVTTSPATYTSPAATSGGTYSSNLGAGQLANPSINATGYSLTTSIAITGTFSISDTFGTTSSTASVIAAAPTALPVPTSGWLTLAGGVAMIGGMAVRRRLKL